MDFYTNVSLQGKYICVLGYENNKRIKKTIEYKPSLFLPSQNPTDYKNLQGQSVERRQFKNIWDAKKFVSQFKDVVGFRYYGMDKWIYQYIHDKYPEKIEYDINLIKVGGIDIEVDIEDSYPDIELADKKITSISYRMGNSTVVFGYGEYTAHRADINYIRCNDETELLSKFIDLWNTEEWMPDVLTGWNIEGFDIPYLVNRITLILGRHVAEQLSPWKQLREKKIFIKGHEVQMYIPVGISVLDYMHLYQKFTQNEQSSYSLNNIAHIELNEKKIDYSEYKNLTGLYKRNHQKYIEYNIHDVDLVFKLEKKLRFIELVYAMAYDAHVNLNDAFTSVLLWDVIIYNYLMNKHIVVPADDKKPERGFEGGFVKDPLVGMHNNVVSVDLTSLYPHIIMGYNISPETFVDKLDYVNVEYCLKKDKFEDQQYATCANGCRFRKDVQGFLSTLMETQFKQRKEYQRLMSLEKNEEQKVKYDKAQHAKKIQLNSLFGALANAGFRFYDPNYAEAITLSGQLSIRFMADQVNSYINKICDTKDVDYIIAIDTDSLYIKLDTLVKKYCPDNHNKIDFLDKFGNERLIPFISKKYEILADRMNAYKQAMFMKRENIADKALWTAKKRYIMNVWDKEGKRYDKPKLKIMGIEVVRSSTPAIIRSAMEQAIDIVMNKNEKELQKYISTFKEQFFKAPFDEVAFPRGISDVDKYADSVTIYKKGAPMHVKGAILYNKLLKDRKMKTWTPIYSGDKIKFAYLKMPNPIKDTCIAAPGFLPFEDIAEYIDYNMQWEKSFIEPLNHIIGMIGWNSKKQDSMKGLFKT